MKYFLSLLLFPLLFSDQTQEKSLCKNADYILKQSISYHDPAGEWNTAILDLELREPRTSVSERFSNVDLDNSSGKFSLERNRGTHISRHQIDEQGQASTLLDGKAETDPEKIKEFFLQPERNANYRGYYQFFYGLPMNLTPYYATRKSIEQREFNGQQVISMDYELKQPMISKTWRIFFSPEDYRVVGVQTMDDPDGEYLVFNGTAKLGHMKIPRFRHWYDSQDQTYLGSDILVNGKLGGK